MHKLITELERLYFLPDQQWHSLKLDAAGAAPGSAEGLLTPAIVARNLAGEANVALDLVGTDGAVRAMVVDFERAADWERVAELYQAVQDELELPAPALSVSGHRGYRLWFSLAEAVDAAQARDFLAALQRKYLSDMPAVQVGLAPAALTPGLHLVTGKWSAFIDPTMGAMFVDEPGLEMAPNMERQADLLARLKSIGTTDFQRGLEFLQPPAADLKSPVGGPVGAVSRPAEEGGPSSEKLNLGNQYADPQSFLLAVMNDPAASTDQRIAAAKALLPYFVSNKGP